MKAEAAAIVVQEFLKGAFDVFDALLGEPFTFTAQDGATADEPSLSGFIGTFPVCMRTRTENGLIRAALLFPVAEAVQLAARVLGAEPVPKSALDAEDFDVLKEAAESALGGGVTSLMESFGRGPESLEFTEVLHLADAGAADLLAFLEPGPTAAAFTFESAALRGRAMLLFSANTEELVPENMLGRAGGRSPSKSALNPAALSPEEMSDILSGFDAGEDSPPAGADQPPRRGTMPANLDMVLDIRLVATARLGRVDMPIGEILALGPGSIIEVGHLVDEPVELLINDRLIARGDVVVVDEKFGLRITEIISPTERIRSLR